MAAACAVRLLLRGRPWFSPGAVSLVTERAASERTHEAACHERICHANRGRCRSGRRCEASNDVQQQQQRHAPPASSKGDPHRLWRHPHRRALASEAGARVCRLAEAHPSCSCAVPANEQQQNSCDVKRSEQNRHLVAAVSGGKEDVLTATAATESKEHSSTAQHSHQAAKINGTERETKSQLPAATQHRQAI